MKFVRKVSTDRAAVGFHGLCLETEPSEDPLVGAIHYLVALTHALWFYVKRVRVFHDEFACPHHTKPWSDLVTELRLDLIEIRRQLPVTLDFAFC